MNFSAKNLIKNAKLGLTMAFGVSSLFLSTTNADAQSTVVEKDKLEDDAYTLKKQNEIKTEIPAYLGDEYSLLKNAGFEEFRVNLKTETLTDSLDNEKDYSTLGIFTSKKITNKKTRITTSVKFSKYLHDFNGDGKFNEADLSAIPAEFEKNYQVKSDYYVETRLNNKHGRTQDVTTFSHDETYDNKAHVHSSYIDNSNDKKMLQAFMHRDAQPIDKSAKAIKNNFYSFAENINQAGHEEIFNTFKQFFNKETQESFDLKRQAHYQSIGKQKR